MDDLLSERTERIREDKIGCCDKIEIERRREFGRPNNRDFEIF